MHQILAVTKLKWVFCRFNRKTAIKMGAGRAKIQTVHFARYLQDFKTKQCIANTWPPRPRWQRHV